MTGDKETDPHDFLRAIPGAMAERSHLHWLGRNFSARILIEVGERPYLLRIEGGQVAALEEGAALMRSWDFAIRAGEAAWRGFWEPHPRPGYHDIFALAKRGEATIEGDYYPLMANLRYVKELLASVRPAAGSASRERAS